VDSFDSVDEIQKWVLESLLARGGSTRPRGSATLELFPVSFMLRHPRMRCVTNPARRWILPLALGEFCWHLSGSNDVHFIEYYSKRWREFAESGSSTICGSSYGHKIFSRSAGEPSQWDRLVELLRVDQQSRRAVLGLFDPARGLNQDERDVACACSLQLMIRSGRLLAFVYMRSNDAIWGLPYDIFFFTMLQELLACELGLELGYYYHFAASLHLYERHFELAHRIVETEPGSHFEMPPMSVHKQVDDFLRLEAVLRSRHELLPRQVGTLHPYWRDLLAVLEWYSQAKGAGGYQAVAEKVPTPSPYGLLLRNMLPKAEAGTRAYAADYSD